MSENIKKFQKTGRAFLKNAPVSPRKMALAAGLIRGKPVVKARIMLKFTDKKACGILLKLLDSAVANGTVSPERLVVSNLNVGPGEHLKRLFFKGKGRCDRRNKLRSNVKIGLEVTSGKEG